MSDPGLGTSKEVTTRELWMAWSDNGGYIAALLGSSSTSELIEERIKTHMKERGKMAIRDLRAVRVTVHV